MSEAPLHCGPRSYAICHSQPHQRITHAASVCCDAIRVLIHTKHKRCNTVWWLQRVAGTAGAVAEKSHDRQPSVRKVDTMAGGWPCHGSTPLLGWQNH